MIQALEQIIGQSCVSTKYDILIRQHARIWLAETYYAQEDIPKTQALLNDFKIAWPKPTPNPLLTRAQNLQNRIDKDQPKK